MSRTFLKFLVFFLILFLFCPISSFGAFIPDGGGGGGGGGGGNGFSEIQKEVTKILERITTFLFTALMILASGFFIFLGIKYIIGWGDMKELHKSLLYLSLGIVLLIISLFVPNLLKNFIESVTK